MPALFTIPRTPVLVLTSPNVNGQQDTPLNTNYPSMKGDNITLYTPYCTRQPREAEPSNPHFAFTPRNVQCTGPLFDCLSYRKSSLPIIRNTFGAWQLHEDLQTRWLILQNSLQCTIVSLSYTLQTPANVRNIYTALQNGGVDDGSGRFLWKVWLLKDLSRWPLHGSSCCISGRCL